MRMFKRATDDGDDDGVDWLPCRQLHSGLNRNDEMTSCLRVPDKVPNCFSRDRNMHGHHQERFNVNAIDVVDGARSGIVDREACATTHCSARELAKLGQGVRLMSTKKVKAHLERNKAATFCGAVHRPSMRFVPVMSAGQKGRLIANLPISCVGHCRERSTASQRTYRSRCQPGTSN
jgi:hypothetical protein